MTQACDRGPEESHGFPALQDHPGRERGIVTAVAYAGGRGGGSSQQRRLLWPRKLIPLVVGIMFVFWGQVQSQ